mmetsp:Transcript_27993/g.58618  ORF Transcript_27993/g.58618 Transcript_27993/m.58618 type:complete len:161 (-) Transcript_27993:305-787(-)
MVDPNVIPRKKVWPPILANDWGNTTAMRTLQWTRVLAQRRAKRVSYREMFFQFTKLPQVSWHKRESVTLLLTCSISNVLAGTRDYFFGKEVLCHHQSCIMSRMRLLLRWWTGIDGIKKGKVYLPNNIHQHTSQSRNLFWKGCAHVCAFLTRNLVRESDYT